LGGTIELLVRLAISMAVVMAVMGLAARFVRRRQEAGLGGGGFARRRPAAPAAPAAPGDRPSTLVGKLGSALGTPRPRRARPVPPVDVIYRRALAKGASVAVVEASGKQFLLGVTEQSITLLSELPSNADGTPGTPGALGSAGEVVLPAPTSRPATAGGRPSELSDLHDWKEFEVSHQLDGPQLEDWQQADRMPASQTDVAATERQNAWKLTLDSLRERTIRR
jgi:hypothetical protein